MTWDILLLLFLPVSVGGLATIFFISVGESIGLVDYPDHRKKHDQPTMTTGGLSIFFTIFICSALLLPNGQGMLVYFVCSSMLIILGLLDDLADIPAIHRLITQSLIALLMCSQGDLFIENLGELFGLGVVNLGYFGYFITVVAVIAAINAFNMIDGIDGLLGSTALIIFTALGFLFSLSGDVDNLKFSLVIAISIIPYLWVNLQIRPIWLQKIFMGDTGSMLIGFSVVWLLIQGTQGTRESFSVATALWLICFPLMDMARVMISRKLRGKSMLEADRTHLHHLLADNDTLSQKPLMTINAFSILSVSFGILLEVLRIPESVSILLFVTGFYIYVYNIQKLLEIPLLLKAKQ